MMALERASLLPTGSSAASFRSRRRKGGLIKRSFSLAGHATSVALEAEFWRTLEELGASRSTSLTRLLASLDARRGERPLASACRLAALEFARVR
jgi:predicted DNA-binding ribbon-helix-helix protein